VSKARLQDDVAAIRRFNRFYTGRIALLDETLLDSAFTLTQARVLFELGTHRNSSAGALVEALGIDAGYLSRILQDFCDRRLITRQRAPADARRADLTLTARGRKVFADLDLRSRRSIGEMIAPLTRADRARLVGAMRAVESQLSEAPSRGAPKILIRPYRIGDVGWAIERHGTLYAEELGWNGEFEALVATLFARFTTSHDASSERFWVAEVNGDRVGCVFVVRNERDATAAQLRCLLVDPKARGVGVGRRLVEKCLTFAKSAGYAKMMLWTNDVLVAARRIYVEAGFELIEESPHHSFGRDLVGQIWAKNF
jgi:DNA-binding MarR family transcriptional regulator/N-acetylglutamate synthase-like GNAT family acetyltransferase